MQWVATREPLTPLSPGSELSGHRSFQLRQDYRLGYHPSAQTLPGENLMTVYQLWLPIVATGVATRVWSTLAWTILPHHKPE